MPEDDDYDDYSENQYDDTTPASVQASDPAYAKKLRPVKNAPNWRDSKLPSAQRAGQAAPAAPPAEDEDDRDEFYNQEVENVMRREGLSHGVDPSLRKATAEDITAIRQAGKRTIFRKGLPPGIYQKTPLTVDEETGGLVTDPILDLSAMVQTATAAGFFGAAGEVAAEGTFDQELADLYPLATKFLRNTTAPYTTIQFPIKAPKRGKFYHVYLQMLAALGGSIAGTGIVYILNRNVAIDQDLSVNTNANRRYIIYQYGSSTDPWTFGELIDTIEEGVDYLNKAIVASASDEYRLWVRIQKISDAGSVDTIRISIPIERKG